ncbi:MAG: UbiD family decarboxylase, partial [Candidatus Binatia bacterium]
MTPANHDLRAFLDEVEKIGELRRIENIPWDKDIGGLVEMILERSANPPAMLFEKIPGARQDMEILCSQIDTLPRLAIAMGTDPNLGLTDFIQAWRRKIRNFEPVPAQFVKDAAIFENRVDTNIDLEAFPIPRWHEEDGGRYIGTDDLVITEDPEEHWINAGTYRVMLQGKDAVALYISPGKHGRVQRQKYFDAGKPCPVVMSFGHHPILFLAGCTDVPNKMSEFDYAGGVIGEPIQLARGPLTGLPIPAYSEIAIEGEMVPGDDLPEGPFGEWPGYYASATRPEPVVRIKALYYRNNPILCGEPPLRPSAGQGFHRSIQRSALIWNALDDAGVPDVQGVWLHPAAYRFFSILKIKQRYPGHAKQAALIASQCRPGAYLGRYVVVVDEDVDIYNPNDVIWAIGTRSEPENIDILRRCWSGPLDPAIPRERKGFNSRAIIDATRPYEWKDKFPAVNAVSDRLKAELDKKYPALLKDMIGTRH